MQRKRLHINTKLLFTLLLTWVFIGHAGAYNFTISGTVYNETDELFQSNHRVNIYIETLALYDSTLTDENGFYEISIEIPENDSIDHTVTVSTRDLCFDVVTWYVDVQSYNGEISDVDFTICYYDDNCYALFDYVHLNDTRLKFYDYSYAYNGIESWFWNFGDGTFSNEQQPMHDFEVSGIYNVTLTITSYDGCDATILETITIIEDQSIINGKVYASGLNLPKGKVYASVVESSDSGLYLNFKSYLIEDGVFSIDYSNILQPSLLYVVPDFDQFDNYYPMYFPTYYHVGSNDTAFYWENYDSYVNTGDTAIINLISYDEVFWGDGTISGNLNPIELEQLFAPADSVALLLNKDFRPVKYTFIENSAFAFENIPYGDYYLLMDIFGIPCKAQFVQISENHPNKHVNFSFINDTLVNIHERLNTENFSLSPNPFESEIKIQNTNCHDDLVIDIYSITGSLIFSTKPTDPVLNLHFLPKGTYLLQLKSEDCIETKKIIKH